MANKNLLDFPQTCPIIDDALKQIKSRIDTNMSLLTDEINDVCSNTFDSTIDIDEIRSRFARYFFDDVSGYFETVRQTNSDLRNSAEKQLAGLHNEIDDLQNAIDELKHELSKHN